MHFAYINPPAEFYSPFSGGAVATVVMEQAQQLVARGHEVTIITAANGDPTYAVGNVVRIPQAGRQTLSFLQRRWSSLKQKLTPWDWPFYDYFRGYYSRALRRLPRQPDVIIVHNDLVGPPYIKRVCPDARVLVWLHNEQRTNQRSMTNSIAATDAFVAVSRCTLDWTVRNHPIPPQKAKAIHNAVNTTTFTPRADLSPRPEGVRVLFLGRIDPNKGPDLVADAVGALRKKGVPVQLSVAGAIWWYGNGDQMADPYMRELKKKMDAVGANYLGLVPRPDVPELIRQHDIACVLSRTNDPCPLVGMEAMASGCAVIATNRGGLPEVVGDAAVIVDPDDFNAVVAGMERLATDPAALLDYKQRGLECARRNTWAARVEILENMIGEMNRASRQSVSAKPDGTPWAMPS